MFLPGTGVALSTDQLKWRSLMKAKLTSSKETRTMNSPNCVAIMAILAEMARCLNQNISKVHLAPIDPTLTAPGSAGAAELLAAAGKN
jgi:hypothetical protein